MKNLIIIGARGMGRETYYHAMQSVGYGTDFTIKGFLDDRTGALDAYRGYAPVIGPVESYVIEKDDRFVCALGDVNFKRHYIELVQGRGGVFLSLVHRSAIIYPTSVLGDGCIVSANSHITVDARIGDFATIFGFVTVGHDVKIGRYCHLGAYAFVGGFAEIGEMVTLHPGAKVLPNKKIGDGATVGAGSVVLRNVKPGVTVFGVPAVPIGE